jgi:hypothetical protein
MKYIEQYILLSVLGIVVILALAFIVTLYLAISEQIKIRSNYRK